MKVALAHDWLTGMRGGEKVLEAICEIFPDAPLYTLVHVPGSVSTLIESRPIHTSPLQKFPDVKNKYRHYLPFMPWAVGGLDVRGYDLVVSTSHCVMKSLKVPAGVPHVSYSHTPMRYVWDQYADYFGPGRAPLPVRAAMSIAAPALRRWDARTADRVTHYIANSENVRGRIRRFYGRDAAVIYPPVDTDTYEKAGGPVEDYYLLVSAFAPYKRIDIALEAFRRLKKRLVIVGAGQEADRLRRDAGPETEFRGWMPAEELHALYARCRALIFPGEEDFGIVPVEGMAAGRPVIAYGRGGATETVVDGETGLYFDRQTPEALMGGVRRFEAMTFDPARCRARARLFAKPIFLAKFRGFLREAGCLPSPSDSSKI